MAITYTEPTFNSVHPGPPLNEAEESRIRVARDAQHQAVATAVGSLVTQVNSDSPKVTTALGKALADDIGSLTGVAVKASAVLESDGTNVNIAATGTLTTDTSVPAADSTVLIGATTYTFVDEAPDAEGDVLIEATVADILTNLVNAIAADATTKTSGKHFCVVAHPLVTAAANATVVTLTAKLRGTVGNSYALVCSTTPDSHLDPSAATMGTGSGITAGVDHTVTIGTKVYKFVPVIGTTEGNVLYGADAAHSLDNLKAAINSTGVSAVQYCAAAHPDVEATTNTDTTQTLEARIAGRAGNAIALATNYTLLIFQKGVAFLYGGYSTEQAKAAEGVYSPIFGMLTMQNIGSGASPIGLDDDTIYRYLVVSPPGETLNSAIQGIGTGALLKTYTTSAEVNIIFAPSE